MKQKLHCLFTLVSLLALATNVSAKDFTGGELFTLQEVQYGKFEARMKLAAASGTVSSMFLYQEGSEIADGRPWVEVDIEVLGKNPNSFQSNIITGKAGAQVTSEKHHAVSPAADQAFHTYAIEWTPTYVRWTVDGKEVRKTETGVNDNRNQVANLTGTQGLRFNLWSSESQSWVGAFDESKLPLFQFINWVKVYRYTPGTGPNGSDFTLDWTDNFDTFDSSRWGKADWTFDGNRVDMTEDNVYCQDGMMILALTRKGEESFNGSVPSDVVSGNCGTSGHESDVTWTLVDCNALTISGTGAIADYSGNDQPWAAYINGITTININNGVTGIGTHAFDAYSGDHVYVVVPEGKQLSVTIDGVTKPVVIEPTDGKADILSCLFADTSDRTTSRALTYINVIPTVIDIPDASIELAVGDGANIGASLTPTEAGNLSYSSNNVSVASVDNTGYVTAVGEGTATITVSFAGNDDYAAAESKTVTVTVTPTLALTETDGVTDAISNTWKGKKVDITFTRTFEALSSGDGKASTVCLPFDLDKPSTATVGTFYTLGGVSDATGEYVVTMNEVTASTLTAGTPYMFMPATTDPISFRNKAYVVPADGFTAAGHVSDANGWEFIGTYEEKTWPDGQTRLYGFAASNFKKSDGTYLNEVGAFRHFDYGHIYPFRCYLVAPAPVSAPRMRSAGSQWPESMKVILVGVGGDVTTIGTLNTRTGEITFDGDDWYTLDGRKLQGMPTQKGLYIVNGKKVVVK